MTPRHGRPYSPGPQILHVSELTILPSFFPHRIPARPQSQGIKAAKHIHTPTEPTQLPTLKGRVSIPSHHVPLRPHAQTPHCIAPCDSRPSGSVAHDLTEPTTDLSSVRAAIRMRNLHQDDLPGLTASSSPRFDETTDYSSATGVPTVNGLSMRFGNWRRIWGTRVLALRRMSR